MNKKKRYGVTSCVILAGMMILSGCAGEKTQMDTSESITQQTDAASESENAHVQDNQSAFETEATQEEEDVLVPDFELPDREGNMVSLSDYRGQTVILNIWASWCPPCKAEMPDFQEMHEEWQAEKEANPDADVPVIIALNMANGYRGETKEQALAFLNENQYTFLTVFDESEYSEIAGVYTSGSIPITYIIDKEGYARDAFWGQTSRTDIEASLDALQ